MTAHDYSPLIDKIRTRLISWTSKCLSYAGRLQLISSVITSISSFWCSVFRLPQRCFDEIESLCSAFLWSGNPKTTSGAKVAWADICKPKIEGGLGLRKLRDVSRVYAYKLIWRLFSRSGSLWVAWTKQNLMRNGFFWTSPNTSLGSWVWRKLLKLREEIKPFIRAQVNNGETVSFWHDHWLPIGRLLDLTGAAGPMILGTPLQVTVKEALGPNGWRLRRTRFPHFASIIEQLRNQPVPSPSQGSDIFFWRHEIDDYKPGFSTSLTWEQIRVPQAVAVWNSVVWFPQGIPRCSFITWLAIRDRLSTGVRVRMWGGDQPCVLCGERDESRDHIFFACPYSFNVWSDVAGKLLGPRLDPDWDNMLDSLVRGIGSRDKDIVTRLCFQVTIYFVWRERNTRIHGGGYCLVPQMVRQIDKQIRNRIVYLDYTQRPRLRNLLQTWFEVSPFT